jgi:hypothetical protein
MRVIGKVVAARATGRLTGSDGATSTRKNRSSGVHV